MPGSQSGPAPPRESAGGGPPGGQERSELFSLHQVHAAEYRFQVELNWKRSQYFLALNLAVLVAGAGLLGGSSSTGELIVAAAVFVAGFAAAILAYRIISWQHDYYRNARERLRRIEKELELGTRGLGTTSEMGGLHVPKGKITPMLKRTVAILGLLDAVGVLVVLVQLTGRATD